MTTSDLPVDATATPQPAEQPSRISRIRHETRRRTLVVTRRLMLSPGMVRLTFTSPDLPGFTSLGFDDHIKLFFDAPDGQMTARDYTPRRYDAAANELDIEFALHDPAGPATAWALQAVVGSTLNIGGPRGSFVVEDSFDWYILVGDETALPAIGRRLAELRPGVPVHVLVEVENTAHQIPLTSRAELHLNWVDRSLGGTSLISAVRAAGLPPGDGYVWVACESALAKSLRRVFVDELGHAPKSIRAAAYWRQGEAGVHQVIENDDSKPGA